MPGWTRGDNGRKRATKKLDVFVFTLRPAAPAPFFVELDRRSNEQNVIDIAADLTASLALPSRRLQKFFFGNHYNKTKIQRFANTSHSIKHVKNRPATTTVTD